MAVLRNTRLIWCFFCLFIISLKSFAVEKFEQPIKIAINETSFPYHFVDKQGEPAGLMVDFWRLWSKKQNVEVLFVPMTWKQTLDAVMNKEVDIHAGMSETQERGKLFSFTPQFFPHDRNIFIHRDFIGLTTPENLLPYTVGVVKNSSHVDTLNKLYPSITLREYGSRYDLYEAALANEIFAFAGIEKLSENYANYHQLNADFPPYKRIRYHRGKFVAAVAKNSNELLSFIEQGLNKITSAEKSAIEVKWLGFDKRTDSIVVALFPGIVPFVGLSVTGKPQGLFVDVWNLWSEKTGRKIEFSVTEFNQSIPKLMSGDIDILPIFPITNTESFKEENLTAVRKLYQANSYVFISNKLENITKIDQLNGQNIWIFSGTPYLQDFKKQHPLITFLPFDSFSQLVGDIDDGQVDAIIINEDYMNAALAKNNMQNSFYRLDHPEFNIEFHSVIKKNNQTLASLINEGFDLIKDRELTVIERQWLPNKDNSYYQQKNSLISLNNTEQQWLNRASNIRVGVIKDRMPLEFTDTNGRVVGIQPDLIRLLSERTSIKFEFIPFSSWEERYNALVNGELDMLTEGMLQTDNQKGVLHSESYWQRSWVMLHKRSLGENLKLNQFYGKTIAVTKGSPIVSHLLQNYPQIGVSLVDNLSQGFTAVQQGRVAGFIDNLVPVSELLKKESLVLMSVSSMESIEKGDSYFVISNQLPLLKQILDRGLSSISLKEKQTIYEQWFEVQIETGLDRSVVLRVSVQIGIIILIIIAVIVVKNRRLNIEINTRKQLEEKMKYMATHDELTGLANRVLLKDRLNAAISFHRRQSLKVAVLFIDLDGFKVINDTYGHDVGDELLIQVARRLKKCVRESDMVVRFGGDEFVLLLTGLHENNEASFVAEKVLENIRRSFQLSTSEANIACSIGIAMFPDDGETDIDLLKVADTLMYRVKSEGKNHYVFNQSSSH